MPLHEHPLDATGEVWRSRLDHDRNVIVVSSGHQHVCQDRHTGILRRRRFGHRCRGATGFTGPGPEGADTGQLADRERDEAAAAKVAQHATIVAVEADGKMRTLRRGTNGFTCMADNPATPGPDPMCMDANALAWVHSWVGHKTPPTGKIGFMCMLEGGTDANNTDPYATAPSAGNHWVKTGPHVMIVGADPSFYDLYPKDANPYASVSYVIWAGTPCQHLMAPVK